MKKNRVQINWLLPLSSTIILDCQL